MAAVPLPSVDEEKRDGVYHPHRAVTNEVARRGDTDVFRYLDPHFKILMMIEKGPDETAVEDIGVLCDRRASARL